MKIISYSIVQETDGSGNTVYTLKRNENLGAGRQPLAENIIDMQALQIPSTGTILGIEIDPLTAQTDKPESGLFPKQRPQNLQTAIRCDAAQSAV